MKPDIIIVGSGPAGISAAFPLVKAGLNILMIDGGVRSEKSAPAFENIEQFRGAGIQQWPYTLGKNYNILNNNASFSPKLNIPTNRFAFSQLDEISSSVLTENFIPITSQAAGGLSTIWGAGICCYDDLDMKDFPIRAADLKLSYEQIARRIGICGTDTDDLADFFGRGLELQPPAPLSFNATSLLARYEKQRNIANRAGIKIGRARSAVLFNDREERQACKLTGLCLWGCARGAIYSAHFDLEQLKRWPNFHYQSGWLLKSIHREERTNSYSLNISKLHDPTSSEKIQANKLILACGPLVSTWIVLKALHWVKKSLPLLSSPVVGFAVFFPERLGKRAPDHSFGLSQLSIIQHDTEMDDIAFGNIFEASNIPLFYYAQHLNFLRPVARQILTLILPAMLVGNFFLSSKYSNHQISINSQEQLIIRGNYSDDFTKRVTKLQQIFRKTMARYKIFLLSGSFNIGTPGSDIHYGGSLSMSNNPLPFQTRFNCEIAGLPGIYVVDGSCLPYLSSKAHTFTLMANADRVGKIILSQNLKT